MLLSFRAIQRSGTNQGVQVRLWLDIDCREIQKSLSALQRPIRIGGVHLVNFTVLNDLFIWLIIVADGCVNCIPLDIL